MPGTFVEAKGTSSANALGVENMAVKCLQGRAVMIDLFAHFGRKRHAVGYDDLMRIMAADGIKVEAGDFVLLRTGFDEVILEGNKKPDEHTLETSCTGLDGSDERLQQWITETKLVALISDNYAVEMHNRPLQPGQCAMLPLHQHCLFKTGVNLGEIWRLSELADWLRKQQPQPLPADRAAAAAAGRRRLAGDAGCDGVTAALRTRALRLRRAKAV